MSWKTDGGPAFPQKQPLMSDEQGMTLRDYFAAKSLQGILSGMSGIRPCDVPLLAKDAYLLADAMLESRNKPD